MEVKPFEAEDADILSQLIVQNSREVLIHDYPNEAIEASMPFYTPKKLIESSKHQLTLDGIFGNDSQ